MRVFRVGSVGIAGYFWCWGRSAQRQVCQRPGAPIMEEPAGPLVEPRHKKTCLRGLRSVEIQKGLLS